MGATIQLNTEAAVSQTAVESRKHTPAAVPMQAPGSAFFALMAGLWGSFVTLLAVSPSTLDEAYDWLTGLPIVWEILVWILTLPWTVAYLVYDGSWTHWLRTLLVVLIATVHLAACAPRSPRPDV